jgi:hypothetical protein
MDNITKQITKTQKIYLSILQRYDQARRDGMVGKYFIDNFLTPETGRNYANIVKCLERARSINRELLTQNSNI